MDPTAVARKLLFNINPPVHRAWDIGFGDAVTVYWFCGDVEMHREMFRSKSLEEIVRMVRSRDHQWGPAGVDYVRPDAAQRSFATGQTQIEAMEALGLRPFVVTP